MAEAIPVFGSFGVVIKTTASDNLRVAIVKAKFECEVEIDAYLAKGGIKNFPTAHMLFSYENKHYRLDVIPVWDESSPNGMGIPLAGTCVELPIEVTPI